MSSHAAAMSFPGDGPQAPGHMLAELDGGPGLRTLAIRPEDADLAWYVFRAATQQERRAEENLIRAGYACYVPRITYWRRLGPMRRGARAERSLFGGYLFVGLDARQAVGDAEELYGVHAVVRIAGVARQVAFAPIAALVAQEVAGEFDKTRHDRRKDPAPGTPIKLVGGMFMGWPAKFVERREDERIELLLRMMGKDTAYVADAADVELPATQK